MRVLRASDHRVVPWKNGGGITREVLVEPDPADPELFLWRISIATVASPGPFSRFPGIDRSIAVLDGCGMRLDVDVETVTLLRDRAPFRFSGDAEVRSQLLDGETTDLNAMSRRGMITHRMERARCDGLFVAEGTAETTILLFSGPVTVAGASLERFDAVTGLARGERMGVQAETPCDMFLIAIDGVERR